VFHTQVLDFVCKIVLVTKRSLRTVLIKIHKVF